ncbi:hypothetical protein VCR15J2_390063 [Vibrio coralliirubri]|uniref:hypothetical protein n=1 Tax=Vibrio coralliirubri TaxID=1516159 RepID=UPI000633F13D|nr:hypothetical protein [Vibrio coralliirubri]CDT53375.1 hypothetical protein VCR15J2_390063 [Vibrio coralliirubri]
MLILNRGKGQSLSIMSKDGKEICRVIAKDYKNGRIQLAVDDLGSEITVQRTEKLEVKDAGNN